MNTRFLRRIFYVDGGASIAAFFDHNDI